MKRETVVTPTEIFCLVWIVAMLIAFALDVRLL